MKWGERPVESIEVWLGACSFSSLVFGVGVLEKGAMFLVHRIEPWLPVPELWSICDGPLDLGTLRP